MTGASERVGLFGVSERPGACAAGGVEAALRGQRGVSSATTKPSGSAAGASTDAVAGLAAAAAPVAAAAAGATATAAAGARRAQPRRRQDGSVCLDGHPRACKGSGGTPGCGLGQRVREATQAARRPSPVPAAASRCVAACRRRRRRPRAAPARVASGGRAGGTGGRRIAAQARSLGAGWGSERLPARAGARRPAAPAGGCRRRLEGGFFFSRASREALRRWVAARRGARAQAPTRTAPRAAPARTPRRATP